MYHRISGRCAQGKSGEKHGRDSGSSPHPIPGWFLEGRGAGEAGVWVRARVRDGAGPCASAGWSGATGSGKRSSRSGWSGAEERLGGEDGADSGPGLSVGAHGALARGAGERAGWARRLRGSVGLRRERERGVERGHGAGRVRGRAGFASRGTPARGGRKERWERAD